MTCGRVWVFDVRVGGLLHKVFTGDFGAASRYGELIENGSSKFG